MWHLAFLNRYLGFSLYCFNHVPWTVISEKRWFEPKMQSTSSRFPNRLRLHWVVHSLPTQLTTPIHWDISRECIHSCSNNSTIVQSCDCLLVVDSEWNKFYIFWLNRSVLSFHRHTHIPSNSMPQTWSPGDDVNLPEPENSLHPSIELKSFFFSKERKQNSNSSRAANERDSRATELKQSGAPPTESIKASTYQCQSWLEVVTAGKDFPSLSLSKRTKPDDHTVKISGQNWTKNAGGRLRPAIEHALFDLNNRSNASWILSNCPLKSPLSIVSPGVPGTKGRNPGNLVEYI